MKRNTFLIITHTWSFCHDAQLFILFWSLFRLCVGIFLFSWFTFIFKYFGFCVLCRDSFVFIYYFNPPSVHVYKCVFFWVMSWWFDCVFCLVLLWVYFLCLCFFFPPCGFEFSAQLHFTTFSSCMWGLVIAPAVCYLWLVSLVPFFQYSLLIYWSDYPLH